MPWEEDRQGRTVPRCRLSQQRPNRDTPLEGRCRQGDHGNPNKYCPFYGSQLNVKRANASALPEHTVECIIA